MRHAYKEGEVLYGYNVSPAERNWRAPNPLGGFFALAPSAESEYFRVSRVLATDVLWVSAGADGSDATGDGSAAKPYKTIQKAVDAAPLYKSTARKYTVVYVKPGTYGAGEGHYPRDPDGNEVTTYGKAAVTIYDRTVHLFSTDGPEKTVIVGTSDSDYADDATAPGCGPNAVRCALFKGDWGNGLTGFTLTGGATGREGDACYGGGYNALNGHAVIADSIISNNVGMIGAGGARGINYRNYFTDNRGPQGTSGGWYSAFVGCVFRDNPSSRNGYGAIMSDSNVYNCLVLGVDADEAVVQDSTSMLFYNSIAVGGRNLGTTAKYVGSVFWNVRDWSPHDGALYEDPCFADAANGDYRLLKCSPALGNGDVAVNKYVQYADTGFDGRRLTFVGGSPLPGAFQEIVRPDTAQVYVRLPNGGAAVSGGSTGLNDLGADGVLSLSPTNGTRPCVGFLVDGVTNLYADLPNGTLTISAAAAKVAGGVTVKALYDENDWYADAVNGADGNPGCAAYPFRTLAGSMKYAVSGDTVHAAPGDYNEGLMAQSDTACISSRVVVASGVRLVADEGPDVTFVSGSNATVGVKTSGTYAGCGSNAVRCVYLFSNARIEGFTIRNGRFNGESPDTIDSRSGGVMGFSPSTSVAYGCIVTNCWGYRGGNAYSACLANCLVVDGKTQQGAAGFLCSFHGCRLGGKNDNNGQIYQPRGTGVSGCTIDAGSKWTSVANVETSYAGSMTNVVFLSGTISATAAKPLRLVNCVVAEDCVTDAARPYITFVDCLVTNREAIAIGADWRPQTGSPVIDTGLANGTNPAVGEKDAMGGQRVYNGAVDVGAVEYDWRADYSVALGDRVTVESATPGVTLADGKLKLTDGETLTGTWSAGTTDRKTNYSLAVAASGEGTLEGAFAAGDEVRQSVSLTEGAETVKFRAQDAALSFGFGFAGEGYGLLSDFNGWVPGMLLLVR